MVFLYTVNSEEFTVEDQKAREAARVSCTGMEGRLSECIIEDVHVDRRNDEGSSTPTTAGVSCEGKLATGVGCLC